MLAMPRTAAALIIGNEILTGKIQEGNLAYLGQELFKLGIVLARAIVCRDDVDVIVKDLNTLRASHDMVFTSGGVGPTHDDVTLPAIAKAFGRELVRAPEIEVLIRNYHGDRTTADHLRMADIPAGARLLASNDVPWPTIAIDSVYILPGVPEIFRMKFPVLRPHLSQGTRFHSRAVFTLCDEGEIAAPLALLAERHSELFVGSYPVFRIEEYRLKVTVDGADEARVAAAFQELVALLPSDKMRARRVMPGRGPKQRRRSAQRPPHASLRGMRVGRWLGVLAVMTLFGCYSELPPPRVAKLRVIAKPDTTTVYIDDAYVASARVLAAQPLAIKPGVKYITFKAPDYFPHDVRVDLPPGTTTIEMKLRPIPP